MDSCIARSRTRPKRILRCLHCLSARAGRLSNFHLTHPATRRLGLRARRAFRAHRGRRRWRCRYSLRTGDHHLAPAALAPTAPFASEIFHRALANRCREPSADSVHGPAGYSGALSRLLRRRLLDGAQPAAADGHVLFRVRSRAAHPLRRRSEFHRLRALFSGWNAPLAGLFRAGWPRSFRDYGAPQFRQEADLPPGHTSSEPGGIRSGDGIVRRRDFRCCIVAHSRVHTSGGALAPGTPDSAASVNARHLLVPFGVGGVSPGSRPIDGLSADTMVLHYTHLLPRSEPRKPARACYGDSAEKSHVRAGARLSRHAAGTPRAPIATAH